MSKRKVVAGGYEESSDGSDSEAVIFPNPPAKKAKPAPFAPPRLSLATRPGPNALQLPKSCGPSVHRSVFPSEPCKRPTPTIEPTLQLEAQPGGISTSGNTPERQDVQELEGTVSDSEPERAATNNSDVSLGNQQQVSMSNNSSGLPQRVGQARSNLSLERQFNELKSTFEDFRNASIERERRANGKLDQLLEVVNRLEPNGSLGSAPGQHAPTAPAIPEAKNYLANPLPTTELVAIISKVVSEARNRVGKKRGGPEDNSIKEHARNTFYRMLGMAGAKTVRPYFEDEHGEPDTLPAQFVDPVTKYCQPYPHWKAPLTKQVVWIPTYILRFRSMIPKDRGELSAKLHSLSDEQIVTLLHDGPFKSAQNAWRDMKKTNEELEVMRMGARRYQRIDRKAAMRTEYINSVPSLQGPEWEYLTHPGYMSQDESDDEGELVTKRPEHRAQWETNLYEAIHVAELEKAKARSGPILRPRRKIQIVKRPIPHLERGIGSNKITVRIALCGISKSWRRRLPNEFTKYGHLINTRLTAKPDIIDFLTKYPMSDNDDNDNGESGLELDWGAQTERGTGKDEDEPKGEHQGGGNDGGYGREDQSVPGESLGDNGLGNNGHTVDIPIDPQLQTNSHLDHACQPGSQMRMRPKMKQAVADGFSVPSVPNSMRSTPVATQNDQFLESTTLQVVPASVSLDLQMPPPPPLDVFPNPAPSVTVSSASNGLPKKRGRPPKNSQVTPTVPNPTLVEGEESQLLVESSGAAQPKKRGRPPGSKNRKKN